mmetsp:Transcript_10544/g.10619  ORF Transcript_10544/g.10619 Transcript_10544/m.10619 type:complete len:85 (+) Transcript_10544:281-535(+)
MQCEYCENEFNFDNFYSHLDMCSNKTKLCPVCKKNVLNKDMVTHESSGQCRKNAQLDKKKLEDELKNFQQREEMNYKEKQALEE